MQQQPLQSVRKRARKACESCRKRKRRCDGSQPCRACIEYEYDCHYTDQPPPYITNSEQSESIAILNYSTQAPSKKDSNLDHKPLLHRSLVAFPQLVARTVYGDSIPVCHSFGFNIGMPISSSLQDSSSVILENAMSLNAAEKFCRKYHDSCSVLFHVVDEDVLIEGLGNLFEGGQSQQPASPVRMAITFSVLLGSYLSWPHLAIRHDALLLHAQQELHRLTFRQWPLEDHWLLRAWILKTILLRMTSVPDLVWLSSCNMMHVAELMERIPQNEVTPSDATGSVAVEHKPSIFNLAWTLNQMISMESGRSSTANPNPPISEEEEAGRSEGESRLQKIFQRIQELEIHQSISAAKTCLLELCDYRVSSSIVPDPRTILIEACTLFSVYRQIFQRGGCLDIEAVSAVKLVFQSALTAAEELAELGEPWFMLAEFPSQLVCICLAFGRPLTDLLPRASTILHKITERFESSTLKETKRTVSLLIEVCLKSRNEDTSTVRNSLRYLSGSGDIQPSVEDEAWTQFLNQQVFD